jgi:hypothetical protein
MHFSTGGACDQQGKHGQNDRIALDGPAGQTCQTLQPVLGYEAEASISRAFPSFLFPFS